MDAPTDRKRRVVQLMASWILDTKTPHGRILTVTEDYDPVLALSLVHTTKGTEKVRKGRDWKIVDGVEPGREETKW